MAYRLPSERVPLTVDDGPYAGLSLAVERISAWALYQTALAGVARFFAADGPDAELAALRAAFAVFVREAQPTWDIIDHRGPVPETAAGMLRLPLTLSLSFLHQWIGTFRALEEEAEEEEPETAVEMLIAPGALRDQLKAGLLAAREAA